MNEASLVERAATGDGAAIRALYDRYEALVFTAVRRIAGDHDLACDCAQEAWVRAIRALPTFRGDAKFSTWIHRIAVNAAIQMDRQAVRRTERDAAYTGPASPHANGSSPAGDVLLERRLEAAMERLPDGMRRVLVLHDVDGYTHEEIAELLGVTVGTSKSQLFKARARMRELLTGRSAPREAAGAWNP